MTQRSKMPYNELAAILTPPALSDVLYPYAVSSSKPIYWAAEEPNCSKNDTLTIGGVV